MGFILIYLILFLSSFSLYCYKKAQNPLQLNWHHVNWEWSNIDYLDLDSSRSSLFHHSAHHFNLPLQMDQLQSSPHVWDNIRKNRRGEKPKENRVEPTRWTPRKPKSIFPSVSKVPSTTLWLKPDKLQNFEKQNIFIYFHIFSYLSYENNLWNELPKGQLISKGLYDVIVWTIKSRKISKDFCPSL